MNKETNTKAVFEPAFDNFSTLSAEQVQAAQMILDKAGSTLELEPIETTVETERFY